MVATTKAGPAPAAAPPALTWGVAALGAVVGASLALAVGLGVSQAFLVAGVLAPFLFLITIARPHWIMPIYAVLIYADLLSVLTHYQGLPPLARFVGAALLAAVLGYRLVIHRQGLVADEVTWWMLLYGLMVSVGLLYARDADPVMTNIIEFARNFITYLIIINTATTRTRLRRILWALLAAGTILSLLTIYQSMTGNWANEFGGLAQSRATEIVNGQAAPRPGGTINDANYYGLSLIVLVPLALYLVFEGKRLLVRLVGGACTLALIAAIVFTYSRGDALALAILMVAVAIYKRLNPLYLLGIAVALLIAVPILPPNYVARLSTVLQTAEGNQQTLYNETSIRGRAGAVQSAIAMFLDHPLVGVGRENYVLYELEYISGTSLALDAKGIPPHDLYLEVLAEHGLMGLFVVGGLFVMLWRAVLEAHRRFRAVGNQADAELAAWLGLGLVGYMAGSLFLHGAYFYLFWLQMAAIVALRQLSRTAPADGRDDGKEHTHGGFEGDGAGVSPDRHFQPPRRLIPRTHYIEPGSF
ncbi:MAG TPA: O-antigen ligase family protein [Chloroflexia bacterium]|nr:O-antigen ligase family protein [Chloroflexia bacterium]